MLNKIKRYDVPIGEDDEYFPIVMGYYYFAAIKCIGIICKYPEKNPNSLYFWLQSLPSTKQIIQGNSECDQTQIMELLQINIISDGKYNQWEHLQIFNFREQKQSEESNKWNLIGFLYNPRRKITKIFSVTIIYKGLSSSEKINKNQIVIQEVSHSKGEINGNVVLAYQNTTSVWKMLHFQNKDNDIIYGEVGINDKKCVRKLCDGLFWEKLPINLRKTTNLLPNINLNVSYGFYPHEEYFISTYQISSDLNNVIQIQKGFICFQIIGQSSFVKNIRKVGQVLYGRLPINDYGNDKIAAIIQSHDYIQIMSRKSTQVLNIIWLADYYHCPFSQILFTINKQDTICIANNRGRTIIDTYGTVYKYQQKVSGVKNLFLNSLPYNMFMLGCCHLVSILRMHNQEEDQEFMAM